MTYETLKEKYDTFLYHDYKIEEDEQNIYLKYFFEIKNLSTFQPVITIRKKNFLWQNLQSQILKNIAFNLGMIEAMSYYKATCSQYFYIQCGKLKEEQIKWFEKLMYWGLGEFRYINKINVSQENFVHFFSEGKEIQPEKRNPNLKDVLIPIGGGKDSNVTLELLKELPYKRMGFRINLEDVSKKCAEIAGLKEEEIIEVERKIDPNLIKLNQQGFLNGHTPFSAMVAFLTYFVAMAQNLKYIILSNEESANESNIKGENINHQYSKTIEFEKDFRNYVTTYICPNGPEYFSMLRPLSEIQIAKLFSKMEAYHPIFKSCNVGSKSKPWKWCGSCAKCLFPFMMLSPFLEKEKLIAIFGEDLFEKKELLQTFIELCGYSQNKPFECVGTYEEVRYAISTVIRNTKEELPFLLNYYQDHFPLLDCNLLTAYNENHCLPKEFDEILKRKLV